MKNILFILMIFFSSCSYKDYIIFSDEYKAGTFNNNKTKFAFFKFYKISQTAKGLAAFPDGGQSKVLYQGVYLYLFDIPSKKLKLIQSFDGLSGQSISWANWMYFDDRNQLLYSIYPPHHYSFQKKYPDKNKKPGPGKGIFLYSLENNKTIRISDNAETPQLSPDSNKILYASFSSNEPEIHIMDKNGENDKLLDKGYYPNFSPNGNYISYLLELDSMMYDVKFMNLKNNDIVKIASIKNINKYEVFWLNDYQLCYRETNGQKKKYDIKSNVISDNDQKVKQDRSMKVSIGDIKTYTKSITYPEWGIKIQKWYPTSRKEIITAIVNTEKGNQKYRKAILQEISNELSPTDINNLLKLIEEHKKEVQGIDKTKYEINIEETVKYLNNLLKTKA